MLEPYGLFAHERTPEAVADALEAALTMEEGKRREAQEALRAYVEREHSLTQLAAKIVA